MERYGSDKPDLRIDLTCQDVTEMLEDCGFGPFAGQRIKAVAVSGFTATRKQIDKLCADAEVISGNKAYWFKLDEKGEISGGIAKFLQEKKQAVIDRLKLEPNTFVALSCGKNLAAQKTAGVLRRLLGELCPQHMDRSATNSAGLWTSPCTKSARKAESWNSATPLLHANGGLEILNKAAAGEIDPLTITAYQYDLYAMAWSCPPARCGTTTRKS